MQNNYIIKWALIYCVTEEEDDSEDVEEVQEDSRPYSVVFLGAEAVGKSSLIEQFMSTDHCNVYQVMW